MNKLFELKCNKDKLNQFSGEIAANAMANDIYLLKGQLGVGKTTFARLFINNLFTINNLAKPEFIQSPSFPIMISYPLNVFDINHYDLYRLQTSEELRELDFFEIIEKNITIVEWPDILLDNFLLKNFYLIEFEFIDSNTRLVKLFHSKKDRF